MEPWAAPSHGCCTPAFKTMYQQLEASLVRSILKKLRAQGGFWIKLHGGADQQRGLPDIIGCYKGLYFAFEVKRPGGEATPLQAFTLQRIKLAGGTSAVIYSFEEAQELIRERLRRREATAPKA